MEQHELRDWEQRCIQEEPPECTATCPLHVDARAFVREMARGDVESAYAVLARSMPFPGVLGRICDHPCELRCTRSRVDEPIAIGDLERACVTRSVKQQRVALLPRRPHRIAIIGAGLAGLTVAWDLLRKGCSVTLLTSETALGGSLRQVSADHLPADVLESEIGRLTALKPDVRLDVRVDAALLISLLESHDALFLDREAVDDSLLGSDSSGLIPVDPATGATDRPAVFAGGGTGIVGKYSPVLEAFEGRRAALTIERFLQNAALSAGRENDGPCMTRLYTRVEGISPVPRVRASGSGTVYSEAEARSEATRCIQCECMECLKACLYLERYGGYPKKYARQVFGNERVVPGGAHSKNVFVNSCMDCGLCRTVCPNDFDMGRLCVEARRTMLEKRFMPASFHEFALRDMAHASGDRSSIARHEPGTAASAWLYFPSCQLPATAPAEVLASYRYLRERLTGGVGILLGCCGAPARWAGRDDLFESTVAELRLSWESLGRPRIVTACSNCLNMLAAHLPESDPTTLWEIVESHGLPTGTCAASGSTVTISDPCTSRDNPGLQKTVRRIAERLGICVEETGRSGPTAECCGYGGLLYNSDPALAREVIVHRVSRVPPKPGDAARTRTTNPGWYRTARYPDSDTVYYRSTPTDHQYLAYCAMCRDNLASAGARVSHLIEQLFATVDGTDPATRGWISWSQRHDNRERVRLAIAVEHGEEPSVGTRERLTLQMSEQVRRLVDERRILEDDIRAVIDEAERTGRRLANTADGRVRAYQRLGNVTVWVEYTPADEGFVVHNAYSHRMVIMGVKR